MFLDDERQKLRCDTVRNLHQRWLASDDAKELDIASEDRSAFARDVRSLFLLWPEVPAEYRSYYDIAASRTEQVDAAGENHRLEAFVKAWDFCRELSRDRSQALPALEEHIQIFAQRFEIADRELQDFLRLREALREQHWSSLYPGSIPAFNMMRELKRRLNFSRVDLAVKHRASEVFARRFAVPLEMPALSDEEARELSKSTPGRPSTAEAHPEQIRDVLAVVLDFVEDHDPDGGHIPFERVREAVKDAVPSLGSTSGAGQAVLNAVEHLREAYDANVPEPNSTVVYYAEHSAALRKALNAFEKKRLS